MRNWTIGLLLLISVHLFAQDNKQLVILHMNDTHSRIEPTAVNDSKTPDMGGAIRQNSYVESVREENKNVLFFHSGDIVQGTPYFNIFKGKAEIEVFNFMHLDAATIGNHEFDYGLSTLKDIISTANFPFVSTNLDFSETIIDGLTHKHVVIEKDDVKCGIIGLSPELKGLVALVNYEGVKYLDPIEEANKTAKYLKDSLDCDIVICLSHLGYFPNESKMGDITLAKKTSNIDIILGGHSHTFFEEPVYVKNLDGKDVLINQTGEKGFYIGRIDLVLEEKR